MVASTSPQLPRSPRFVVPVFWLFVALAPGVAEAGVTFGPAQLVSTTVDDLNSLFAADLDGDTDVDLVSAAGDTVAWYENIDGAGTFGSEQVIATLLGEFVSVFAVDIDGDGDGDVVSADPIRDTVAWYENTDGAGSFGAEQVISSAYNEPASIFAADLDGDMDVDVVSVSSNLFLFGGYVVWYENTDGQGMSWTAHSFATIQRGSAVLAADLDGDGDRDVVSASRADSVLWYENTDGQGSFGSGQTISTASAPDDIRAADLDGDTDLDIVVAGDTTLSWHENTDGLGTFGVAQVVEADLSQVVPRAVSTADLDDDGDHDLLLAKAAEDTVAWYRNTNGQGSFGPPQPVTAIADGAYALAVADVDADSELDVVVGSRGDDTVAWLPQIGDLTVAGELIIAIGPLPRIRIPANGTGTVNVGQGAVGFERGVWSTSGLTVGTSLFTGVPVITNLGLAGSILGSSTPDPFRNPALVVQSSGTIPNPIGPGSITGLIAYGGLEGSVRAYFGSQIASPWSLQAIGAADSGFASWRLANLQFAFLTIAPWVTAPVVVTSAASTVVSMPGRTPAEIGVVLTLDPEPGETVRRLMDTTWTTGSGFHPPFTYETSWKAWTFAQTVSGVPGTHPPGALPNPEQMLQHVETLTLPGGGLETTNLTQGTGTITLVSPMRLDTHPLPGLFWPANGAWAGFARMTVTFVPEPSTLLLLASGAAGLALLGLLKTRRG